LFGVAEQKTFLMIWFFLLDEQKKEQGKHKAIRSHPWRLGRAINRA